MTIKHRYVGVPRGFDQILYGSLNGMIPEPKNITATLYHRLKKKGGKKLFFFRKYAYITDR